VSEFYRILYIEGTGNLAGGGQISLLELLKKLNREKFEPFVICPFKGNLTSRLESMGIKTIIIPMGSPKKNLFSFIFSIKKMRSLFLKLKVNLVHANTSRCALYGGLAAKPLGIPMIWHVRVIESEGLYDRFLVSLCTKLITVSIAVQKRFEWLLKKYPEKIAVIYNGVDLREFNPEINGNDVREEFDIPLDIPVAGVLGNLIPWKGQEYFIQAANEVIKTIPRSRFLVVGDGECRKKLEDLAEKLGLRGKIIFTGRRFDIFRIIAAMDVVVHSSISPEPFARVVIESMATGKPVVAMNEGGIPEVIENNISGILIPPKSSSLMAQAIIDLFKDKEKAKKIGLTARINVEKKFSIEENAKKTEEVYLKILNA
jgi:glycosyltransferase involved in cell wall biosynthesis